MTMLGMDPEALDAFASTLERSAGEIDAMLREAVGAVTLTALGTSLSTLWRGPNAQAFAATWQSRHVVELHALARQLREAAGAARRQSAEQRQASASGGGSGGHGLGPDAAKFPREWVDFAIDTVKDALDMFKHSNLVLQAVPALLWTELGRAIPWMPKPHELFDLLGEWHAADAVENAELGPLAVVGIALAAYEVERSVEQYGWMDEHTIVTITKEVPGAILSAFVPGGGLAWKLGTSIGEWAGVELEKKYHVFEHAFTATYGDVDSMTPAQIQQVVHRTSNPALVVLDMGNAAVAGLEHGVVDNVRRLF